MPINAFGGGPGSGKTYGVMEHVILPAIAGGRFVVTNIDGLNTDLIYEYVAKNFYKGKIFCIGHIRHVDRSRPGDDDFFPGEDSLDKPNPVPALDANRVVGGDMVVVDEATRYWPQSEKVKRGAAFFFREHRHFANELGHTCDLVVIDPDITMLARALRGKIELSSLTHKTKSIGLNRYVVRLFRGAKLTGKPHATKGPYSFSPDIFALYKSYSHEAAQEQAIDKRQNILASKGLWTFMGGFLSLAVVSSWFVYRFFKPPVETPPVAAYQIANYRPGQLPHLSMDAPTPATFRAPAFSDHWRVVGSYSANGENWVIVASSTSGRLRLESPSVITGAGALAVGDVDGSRVTTFSGAAGASVVAALDSK